MLRILGCALFAFTLLVSAAPGGGKEGDKDKETPRKDPAKDPRAVKGKVVSVDLKGNAFTIEAGEKAESRTFKVTKETEFLGPRGGKGEGLKDDRMAKGYDVIVIPGTEDAMVREVHLSYRKPEEPKKAKEKEKEKK